MDKKLFTDLLTSMKEMVAIERGELQPAKENIHRHFLPDRITRTSFKGEPFGTRLNAMPAGIRIQSRASQQRTQLH